MDYKGTKGTASGATASLVCGLIGLVLFGLVLGVVAIVFATRARTRIRENPELGGSGRATAGLVLGIIDVVGWALGLLITLI